MLLKTTEPSFSKRPRPVSNGMKKLWFKRKWFGWGWRPYSWEGYVVTAVFIVVAILMSQRLTYLTSTSDVVVGFVAPLIALILVFIGIAYYSGEKPRWQWGKGKPKK